MTVTDQEEIAELKAQIAEAESRIVKLEAKHAPKRLPQRLEDEGVRITEIQPAVACELPSEKQLRQLATVVIAQFPKSAPSYPLGAPAWRREDIERKWHKSFGASFMALAAMKRMPEPDRHHYASHFLDHAASWLRSHGISADIGETFFAACLAFGDVPWVDPRVDGCVLELGLNVYVGKPASAEAWRRVLETGELLPPSPPLLKLAHRSPSRVIYG